MVIAFAINDRPQDSPGALLWDVDGTLAETERDGHRLAFNRALAEAGLAWQWSVEDYRELLAIGGGRERLSHDLERREGKTPDPERVQHLQAAKQRHYAALIGRGAIGLRPGVQRLIQEAAAAGWCQAIVTTSGRQAVQALLQTQLQDLAPTFSLWICGEDVTRKKPDPQAYQLAIETLAIAPERNVAIEDSVPGLTAASGAQLATLITLSEFSASEPLERFQRAAAIWDGLGDPDAPASRLRGPETTRQGVVDLDYLATLRPLR
ncbi:MAG: HAD-IA family hydrolase [Cyanobacteriota bacterium]